MCSNQACSSKSQIKAPCLASFSLPDLLYPYLSLSLSPSLSLSLPPWGWGGSPAYFDVPVAHRIFFPNEFWGAAAAAQQFVSLMLLLLFFLLFWCEAACALSSGCPEAGPTANEARGACVKDGVWGMGYT